MYFLGLFKYYNSFSIIYQYIHLVILGSMVNGTKNKQKNGHSNLLIFIHPRRIIKNLTSNNFKSSKSKMIDEQIRNWFNSKIIYCTYKSATQSLMHQLPWILCTWSTLPQLHSVHWLIRWFFELDFFVHSIIISKALSMWYCVSTVPFLQVP